MNLEVIRNCLQQRDFKRLFCEGLLWNQVPHDKPIPLTLSKQVFEVVPIAEAEGFVVFMARCPNKKRAPSLDLRMRITEQLLLQKFEHLVIFPHKENSQYFCHWFHQKQHQSVDLKLEDLEQSALLFETLTIPLDTPNAPSLSQTLDKMNQFFRRAQRATGGNRMNPVSKAFKHLHEAINQTEQFVKNNLPALSSAEIREMVSTLTSIEKLREKTENLEQEWHSIRQSQPLFDQLKPTSENKPSKEKTKTTKNSYPRLERGVRTPEEAFYLPILQAIEELGGAAVKRDVLERVHELLRDRLTASDYGVLASTNNKVKRWENTAAWVRQQLVNKKYLKSNSPYGVWEITEEGRQYLRQHLRES